MTIIAAFFFFAAVAGAAVPQQDSRNTITPDTNTHFRFEPPATLAAWEERRTMLRKRILTAAGLAPMPVKQPMHPQVFGRLERSGFSIEKVLVDTWPGYYLGGNLYRPLKPGRHPAVLLAHGHWRHGRLEVQPLNYPHALASTLARLGFVVFMYDMTGYNDTRQTPHRFGGDQEQLWSFGPLGLQLWNSIRALDFVQSLPDVNGEQVGMTGPSGGGTQTMMLTAVDDRIKFSAPINMVSAYMQGGDDCENAPGLRIGTNNVEIAALAAPRPMLIVAATGDWTKHVPDEEFPAIQKVYDLYGKRENVTVQQFHAPHNMNTDSRQAVERFMARTVLHLPESEQVTESGIKPENPRDLLALSGRPKPEPALDYAHLFAAWREQASQQMAAVTNLDVLRGYLSTTLSASWPGGVSVSRDGDQITLTRDGAGDRVTGRYRQGSSPAVLIVHPDGADAGWKFAEQSGLAAKGQTLLALTVFQTGSSVARRKRPRNHFLTFNVSEDAARVQDILTALRFLETERVEKIELYGEDRAAWWTTFAAAIAPGELTIRLHAKSGDLKDAASSYLQCFNVPGILRVGGLQSANRLLAARREGQ